MTGAGEPTIRVLLDRDAAADHRLADLRDGLGSVPRSIAPSWLYDDRGSALFDAITRLPEYYPTEAERALLHAHAAEVAALTGADTLVELGSGTGDKTTTLIDAFVAGGVLRRFVPVDVAEGTLRASAAALGRRYPHVLVEGIVADFTAHLEHLPAGDCTVVAFLGGTIGNFTAPERAAFLRGLVDATDPGDHLLLGTDLVKSADRLIAAYHDPGGVTAEFVLNGLRVLNRELGADFDVDDLTYVPWWDPVEERMDLRVRAGRGQRVTVAAAGLAFDLAACEEIRVEISTKFRPEGLRAELAAAGFDVERLWSDGDFALTLARRR